MFYPSEHMLYTYHTDNPNAPSLLLSTSHTDNPNAPSLLLYTSHTDNPNATSSCSAPPTPTIPTLRDFALHLPHRHSYYSETSPHHAQPYAISPTLKPFSICSSEEFSPILHIRRQFLQSATPHNMWTRHKPLPKYTPLPRYHTDVTSHPPNCYVLPSRRKLTNDHIYILTPH